MDAEAGLDFDVCDVCGKMISEDDEQYLVLVGSRKHHDQMLVCSAECEAQALEMMHHKIMPR